MNMCDFRTHVQGKFEQAAFTSGSKCLGKEEDDKMYAFDMEVCMHISFKLNIYACFRVAVGVFCLV